MAELVDREPQPGASRPKAAISTALWCAADGPPGGTNIGSGIAARDQPSRPNKSWRERLLYFAAGLIALLILGWPLYTLFHWIIAKL